MMFPLSARFVVFVVFVFVCLRLCAFFVSVAPCGVTSIVLCAAYNVSPENIIKAIFVSTIASIGTIFFAIKYLTL